MKVKICGLMAEKEAKAAASAGADYLGLVLAPSRRQVDAEKARQIVVQVKDTYPVPEIVGVFVNRPAEEVNSIARTCSLDRVQLCGEESWDYCRDIEKPLIKVIHITTATRASDVLQEMENSRSWVLEKNSLILLDSLSPGAFGGTGQTFDWQLAAEISARFPVLVAGGLTPQNVGEMIRIVKPWGVDVSSGVETEGKKDILKIRNYIQAAKAFAV
jgi:phosphoribosylanthranilate isomerase